MVFLHSFTNVHTVRFLADAGTPATTPHIPYPYLLPSTMTHLVISRCSLESHSVEGMLSPDTSLRSLELRGLEHGATYLPPVPGPMEVATWRALTGIEGFRAPYLDHPPLPTLRRLHIDYSRNSIFRILYPNDPMSSLGSAVAMLHQLFRDQSFQADIDPMLLPTEHFPIVLRCNMLTYLDIAVAHNLFHVLSGALADVQFSLRVLILRYPACVFYLNSSQTHVSLAALLSLRSLTIHTSPHFWHYSIQSTFTWASLPRSLESSELRMIVSYEGDDYVLHTNMCRTHLEHMLQGPVDSILQLQWVPFCGEFSLQLATQEHMSFPHRDYEMASTLLDEVAQSQLVLATVLPVEVITHT
ncbi:uncharacterized protein ARMOST_11522 [Armillaria ostoyae]|uniref:F-box domain-containing protein n=1 Tax=Armillaria ostoyae TaxID=47428 RepID=A0A284RHC0_ARMOS|nr:uncharacterized protein ARMOST_11522 [Armillaria ostoyae]